MEICRWKTREETKDDSDPSCLFLLSDEADAVSMTLKSHGLGLPFLRWEIF